MRFKDFFSLFFVLLFSFINSPTSALEDTLTIAAAYDAKALDPAVTIDTPSIFVGAKIHENLLCIDENSKLQPQLAESYEQIDSQAYRFILRKGVRFHNGSGHVPYRLGKELEPCLYMSADEVRVGANKKAQGLVLYPRGYQSLAGVYFE